jgi:hypothetical protein
LRRRDLANRGVAVRCVRSIITDLDCIVRSDIDQVLGGYVDCIPIGVAESVHLAASGRGRDRIGTAGTRVGG